jgi:AcrR family transcriptional regulator
MGLEYERPFIFVDSPMPVKKRTRRAPAEPPAAPTARGEVTRSKLLEAAHDLFLRNGFHGTSMRDIADSAGVAVGGLYNHFPNKEEVFAAVLDAYHPYHIILPALESIEAETVEEFMRQAARQLYEGIAGAETQLLPLIFIELVEFQGRHVKQLVERLMPTLLGFVQRFSQRRGHLRALPPPVMLRTFMGMLVGFFLSEMLLRDTPLFRQSHYDWFGGMVDVYLHGILEPEA